MPERSIIVTAADAGFFGLLRDLVDSIAAQRNRDEATLAVFDLGLTESQRAWLAARVDLVVEPGWDLRVPDSRRAQPHWRAFTVRPFLPRYFPDHDVLIWLDADVWLQDWRAIRLYRAGARLSGFALTPQTDRAYVSPPDLVAHRFRRYKQAFGMEIARAMRDAQELNAGAFAGRPDSKVWATWARRLQEAIDRSGGAPLSDQTAFNVALYGDRLSTQLLPAICNWQCHQALPVWDEKRRLYCEPFLPFEPISLLHLTHWTKDRSHKVATLQGGRREMSLRYPRAGADMPAPD